MFPRSATQLLKASFQRTQKALQHTVYDVTETLAEIQGKTKVKRQLERVRKKNNDRYQGNLWLTAYHNRDCVIEDIETIRDITLGVMDCVKTGVGKAQETTQALQETLERAIEGSKLAQDLKQATIELIRNNRDLVKYELATQKAALLETLSSFFEGKADKGSIQYFLDEVENDEVENIDSSEFKPISSPSFPAKLQQTMNYVVRRSEEDSRLLAQWLENTLYDGVEFHSQDTHSALSKALSTEREQNKERNQQNRLQETAKAVSTIREGWQALRGVFVPQQTAMGR
jgi:hypothetical protein